MMPAQPREPERKPPLRLQGKKSKPSLPKYCRDRVAAPVPAPETAPLQPMAQRQIEEAQPHKRIAELASQGQGWTLPFGRRRRPKASSNLQPRRPISEKLLDENPPG